MMKQALVGSTGYHARVLLLTITDKEFPVAREVFGLFGDLVEVQDTGALTLKDCVGRVDLPFVLVQSSARTNMFSSSSVTTRIREFRPQHIIVIGTAGGIHRPVDDCADSYQWAGPPRGDVVVSEYVHYSAFMKVTRPQPLMRHLPMDQPAKQLVDQARAVRADDAWRTFLGSTWEGSDRKPEARIEEILSGEALQDNPLEPMQQFLMHHFDRAGATEMESAGVAQCLYTSRDTVHYAPGYLTIRGISDLIYARGGKRRLKRADLPATGDKTVERDDWSPRAAAAASAFAVALTARLVARSQPAQPGQKELPGYVLRLREGPVSEPADSVSA